MEPTAKQKEIKKRIDFIRDNPDMTPKELAAGSGCSLKTIYRVCQTKKLSYKKYTPKHPKRKRYKKKEVLKKKSFNPNQFVY